MSRTVTPEVVGAEVLEPLANWARERSDIEAAFVTGSFVAAPSPRREPNLNVYFVCDNASITELTLDLRAKVQEIAAALAPLEIGLALDVHPYGVSLLPGTWRSEIPLIWITTKLLDRQAVRYDLPPHIGPGWCIAYEMLCGSEDALEPLAAAPERSHTWLAGVHEALARYQAVLVHLPLMLSPGDQDRVLLRESARYAEEAAKDCVGLCCNEEELAAGLAFEILSSWRARGLDFLEERLPAGDGAALRDALSKCGSVDEQRRVEAEEAWRAARSALAVAWRQYLRVAADLGVEEPELLRVNAFV